MGRIAGLLTALTATGLCGSLAVGTAPAVAAGPPNLVVSDATVDRTSLAEGDVLHVTYTVKNAGGSKAGRSRTRFYLTQDWAAGLAARKASRTHPRSAPQDIRLVGDAGTKAVTVGRSLPARTVELTVPVGTQPGGYTVLACVDDTGKVTEGNEVDNCRPAAGQLEVDAPVGNDELVLQSFADTAAWPDADEEEWDLETVRSYCEVTVTPRVLTLTQAISSARSFLQDVAGAGAMRKLAESGQADTVVKTQELAAVAVTRGVPGLALAALLRAHELEPRNAGHLINAAGIAVSVGLPNEALAFLDASVAGDLRRPAMGVSQQAIALVVRGEALVMTGRNKAAGQLFRHAKNAEPMLSEADAGLAHSEACKDEDDEKVRRFVRKSRQRSQEKDEDPTTPIEEEDRPEPVLDYGHGKETPLRELPIGGTTSQMALMRQVYEELQQEVYLELDGLVQEQVELEEHLRQTDEARTVAEISRRDDILELVGAVSSDPDIVEISNAATDKTAEIMAISEEFFAVGPDGGEPTYTKLMTAAYEACEDSQVDNCYLVEMNSTCRPKLNQAHAAWTDLMGELQDLLDTEMAEVSRRMSTYAANLMDTEAHRLAVLAIEQYERDLYALLVQQAAFWSVPVDNVQEECVDPLPAEVLSGSDAPHAVHAGACNESRKAANFVANFGPVKIKVTCEKIQLEGSVETLPLLHAFAEVSYEFRSGGVTVFAGSKGEGKLGIVEAGFKSGIYLTSDRNGDLTDVGWRVGPSASIVGGATEYQVLEDNVDISFVPVFATSQE